MWWQGSKQNALTSTFHHNIPLNLKLLPHIYWTMGGKLLQVASHGRLGGSLPHEMTTPPRWWWILERNSACLITFCPTTVEESESWNGLLQLVTGRPVCWFLWFPWWHVLNLAWRMIFLRPCTGKTRWAPLDGGNFVLRSGRNSFLSKTMEFGTRLTLWIVALNVDWLLEIDKLNCLPWCQGGGEHLDGERTNRIRVK
jgi:hypothetical protein